MVNAQLSSSCRLTSGTGPSKKLTVVRRVPLSDMLEDLGKIREAAEKHDKTDQRLLWFWKGCVRFTNQSRGFEPPQPFPSTDKDFLYLLLCIEARVKFLADLESVIEMEPYSFYEWLRETHGIMRRYREDSKNLGYVGAWGEEALEIHLDDMQKALRAAATCDHEECTPENANLSPIILDPELAQAIDLCAYFYFHAIRKPLLFGQVNNNLFMNMANGLLQQLGQDPV